MEEAAELLGVSVKTFNKVLHTESIPARKIGREWKFSRRALIDWIGAGRSDEFYREARTKNGYRSDDDSTLKPQKPRGAERRTSGWQLELD
ncbi:MAG TPA: DNA-binding protein [Planctomycetes bacterium]|nr:DNA-binding protein [Planctomycetota bacterium]